MIAVVHLVWGPLGATPLRRFLDSYHRHPAGAEHELVVLFNGVQEPMREELSDALAATPHRLLTLPAPVQDLDAYAAAAAQLEHERFCFLNSYSELLADDWLGKMGAALDQPGAGMVGATGSWASLQSGVLNAFLLPNPYRGHVPKRSVTREQMAEIDSQLARERANEPLAQRAAQTRAPTLLSRVVSTLKSLRPMPEQLLRFEAFPAYHLRTNAFMLDARLLACLKTRPIHRKMDAYLLESGRQSFTRQVQRRGLRTLVVARDGSTYDHPDWPESNTLWQRDQEGLLVADNQTRSYSHGGLERRQMLSAFAWAGRAEPLLP